MTKYVNIKPSSIPPNFKEMSYCRNLASLLEYQELRNYFIEGIGNEILSEDERNIARIFGYTIRSTVWMNTKGKVLYAEMNTKKDVFEKLGMQKFRKLYDAIVNRQYNMHKLFTGDKDVINKELGNENGYIVIHANFIGETE